MANKRTPAEIRAREKDRQLFKMAKVMADMVEKTSKYETYSSSVCFRFRKSFLGRKPATMVLPMEIRSEDELEPMHAQYKDVVEYFNNIRSTMSAAQNPYLSAEQEIVLMHVEQLLVKKGFRVNFTKKHFQVQWWDGTPRLETVTE